MLSVLFARVALFGAALVVSGCAFSAPAPAPVAPKSAQRLEAPADVQSNAVVHAQPSTTAKLSESPVVGYALPATPAPVVNVAPAAAPVVHVAPAQVTVA